MVEDLDERLTPPASGLVERPDQLAALGVNADHRHALRSVVLYLRANVTELLIPLSAIRGFARAGLKAFEVHPQGEFHFPE